MRDIGFAVLGLVLIAFMYPAEVGKIAGTIVRSFNEALVAPTTTMENE
jgi:hypothetical protein